MSSDVFKVQHLVQSKCYANGFLKMLSSPIIYTTTFQFGYDTSVLWL